MLEGLVVVLGLYHHVVVVGGDEPSIARLPSVKITMTELSAATDLAADFNGVWVADVGEQSGPSIRFSFPLSRVINIGARS
ncbi:hypothetical protein [Stutzerimonas nitrititolerans]|uniref:hypothetical protein n=1 Tax=Stutzerimonas nitrititolerans TaxID=2482751 RepID=UPI0028A73B0A|nr:hypothetical protein [Stutzerimonas nitrititolerans]